MPGAPPPAPPRPVGSPLLGDARAVLFDMDDTLLNWREAEEGAIAAVARSHFAPRGVPLEDVRRHYAAILDETWQVWCESRKWIYVTERLRLLAERVGLPQLDTPALGAQFHVEAGARLGLLHGAEEALAAARRGRRTAILTNGRSEIQRPKVERFRLHEQVDFVGITGELGHWKPDARAFEVVLERLGVAPHEAVMVGDTLDFDVQPAKRLGMRTVWVTREAQAHPDADLVVGTPGEMVAHL